MKYTNKVSSADLAHRGREVSGSTPKEIARLQRRTLYPTWAVTPRSQYLHLLQIGKLGRVRFRVGSQLYAPWGEQRKFLILTLSLTLTLTTNPFIRPMVGLLEDSP